MGRRPKYKKECPKKDKDKEYHNSPEWYTKEFVPMIGANFNCLTGVGIESRLMANGMYINTAAHFYTVVTPPIDANNSAMLKIRELYAEIREANAGAANYTPEDLAAYIYNVMTMRTLVHYAMRGLAAIRYGSSLYRESPAMFCNIAGFRVYSAEAAAYSGNFNDLSILCKDIEYLPVVPLSYMDRNEFLFSTIFADSPTTRPALMAFIPAQTFSYAVSGGALGVTAITGISNMTIAQVIAQVRTLYDLITGNPLNAIIRGDLLKSFGASAMRNNLIQHILDPLRIGYNEDVACQVENASIIGQYGSITFNIGTPNLVISSASSHVNEIYSVNHRLINFHGVDAPRDGALLALTRLASTGSKSGSTTTVTHTSGVTIIQVNFITAVSQTAAPTFVTLGAALTDMFSTIQSTAIAGYRSVIGLVDLIDRFPAIIYDPSDPLGCLLDVDNFTILDSMTLSDYTELANRSLMDVHLVRKASGRIDKDGMLR